MTVSSNTGQRVGLQVSMLVDISETSRQVEVNAEMVKHIQKKEKGGRGGAGQHKKKNYRNNEAQLHL